MRKKQERRSATKRWKGDRITKKKDRATRETEWHKDKIARKTE